MVSCCAVYHSAKMIIIILVYSVLTQVVYTVFSTIINVDVGVAVVIGVVEDYYFVCFFTYTKCFK